MKENLFTVYLLYLKLEMRKQKFWICKDYLFLMLILFLMDYHVPKLSSLYLWLNIRSIFQIFILRY